MKEQQQHIYTYFSGSLLIILGIKTYRDIYIGVSLMHHISIYIYEEKKKQECINSNLYMHHMTDTSSI